MSFRPFGLRVLLALLLVLAQQFGGPHRLGHAADALAGLPQSETCANCLALAALDSPAVDAPPAVPPWRVFQASPPPGRTEAGVAARSPCAYRSRAPPRLA